VRARLNHDSRPYRNRSAHPRPARQHAANAATAQTPTSHHLWLSEHESERAIAILLCDHCPVLTVCRDTAELRQETWAFGAAATLAQARDCHNGLVQRR
jgi:hypothetical protein